MQTRAKSEASKTIRRAIYLICLETETNGTRGQYAFTVWTLSVQGHAYSVAS